MAKQWVERALAAENERLRASADALAQSYAAERETVERLRAQLAAAEKNYNSLASTAMRQAKELDERNEVRYRSIGPQEPLD